MSSDDEKSTEELKRELAFFKSQTKVLRKKNRDLRNALLLADSKSEIELEETAEESLSDIRKIIADSKKQISDKLSELRESIDEKEVTATSEEEKQPTLKGDAEAAKLSPAPTTPKFPVEMLGRTSTTPKATPKVTPKEQEPKMAKEVSGDRQDASMATAAGESEILLRQVAYLKREVDRLEEFLDQSERVNDRLRQLLAEHSIDISEITKAIEEVSITAISPTSSQMTKQAESTEFPPSDEKAAVPPVVAKATAPTTPALTPSTSSKPSPSKKKLDPAIVKLFDDLREKLNNSSSDEEITMEILDLREKLMALIPHSRVFYEMQAEYRRWKRGTSSPEKLKEAIKKWEETIATQ